MTEFPASLRISEIDRKAAEYDLFQDARRTFSDLYQGGAVLKDAVYKYGKYLLQKPKEHSEVFGFRKSRFAYTNLLGNVGGWYQAALFKTAAQFVKKNSESEGEADAKLPPDVEDFCEQFEKDCDNAGTDYNAFWSKVFESLFLHSAGYILIDLPSPDDDSPAVNLAQQTSAGQLNPFLVLYEPNQVINWETDRYGNLEWCIIAVTNQEREAFQPCKMVDYWYYFDCEQVACYSAVVKDGKRNETDEAKLVEGYPRRHAMSDLQRIPVRKIEVPVGLWLANRVYMPLLNHLNLENGFDHGLFNAALAQLWIKGQFDDTVTRSEWGWIHLPNPDNDIGYLEPTGAAFEAIDKRLSEIAEGIYKACYLMDQARSNKSTPTAQSGVSKAQDKTPGRDALSGFGAIVRAGMQAVYTDVLAIRGFDKIIPDVRGFDFEDKIGLDELTSLEESYAIDIQSDTYRRERDMAFTRARLPNLNTEVQATIDAEIQANPTPEGAAALLAEQARADQVNKFAASFKGATAAP